MPVGLWKQIRKFYKEAFSIDREYVDLMSSIEILTLCASGLSNHTISHTLNINDGTVKKEIKHYFGFDGWSVNSGINPLFIYSIVDGSKAYKKFKEEIAKTGSHVSEQEIKMLYNMCVRFTELTKDLETNWK